MMGVVLHPSSAARVPGCVSDLLAPRGCIGEAAASSWSGLVCGVGAGLRPANRVVSSARVERLSFWKTWVRCVSTVRRVM